MDVRYHVFVTKQTTTPPLPSPFMARSDISRVAGSKTSAVTRNATRNSDIRVVPSSSFALDRRVAGSVDHLIRVFDS